MIKRIVDFITSAWNENNKKLAAVENPLSRPAAYALTALLQELKWGRPATDQLWLDEKIKELSIYRVHVYPGEEEGQHTLTGNICQCGPKVIDFPIKAKARE